jgi:hypothetical protein
MKVQVTKVGYYGVARRNPGEILDLKNEKEFSKKWMKRLDEADASDAEESRPASKKVKSKKVEAPPPEDLSSGNQEVL